MALAYSVILPAYNEEKTIERALTETARFFDSLRAPYEMLVVDDGSQDRTAARVQRMQQQLSAIRLFSHLTNLGKGAAVRTGAMEARGEWMLFLDCDLSAHPSAFSLFLPHLSAADILIGSRRASGARILVPQPPYREQLGRAFNLLARWTTGIPSLDTQCGFKAFHARTKHLFRELQTRGWAFDVELLARAFRERMNLQEIPIPWRHCRESRVRISQAAGIIRDLWRIRKNIA